MSILVGIAALTVIVVTGRVTYQDMFQAAE